MPEHSAYEQYLLELINAERAKVGAQPLAFNGDLSEAAEGHSKWMLATDTFSHTGAGGSSATTRMTNAGYTLSGSWATGENIAWATTRAPSGYADEVLLLHNNLMNSSGHRANILNNNFREVGLGFEVGDYNGRESAFVTQNFAKSGSDLFLTGVAFDDKNNNKFYDPGEGLAGITVTAISSTGASFTTQTKNAGGYDLVLKPGTYTVTFSGAGIETSTHTVQIGTRNVKLDLVDPEAPSAIVTPPSTPEPVQTTQPDPAPDPEPEPVQTTQPDPEPEPVQTAQPEPTPTTTQPDPAPTPTTDPTVTLNITIKKWVSLYFSKSGEFHWQKYKGGTRSAHEDGACDQSQLPSVAKAGDAFVFAKAKSAVLNLDDLPTKLTDLKQKIAEKTADRFEWAADHATPVGGQGHFDDGGLAAKLLAQLSQHNAGMNGDIG
jgi:hypothetical protein